MSAEWLLAPSHSTCSEPAINEAMNWYEFLVLLNVGVVNVSWVGMNFHWDNGMNKLPLLKGGVITMLLTDILTNRSPEPFAVK